MLSQQPKQIVSFNQISEALLHGWDEVLQGGDWYADLPASLRRHLLSIAVPRIFEDGEFLFRRGDEANGVYAILDGSIHISRVKRIVSENKATLLFVLYASSWYGVTAMFDRAPRTHDARAAEKTVALHFGQRALEPLLETCPSLWRDFGHLLTLKVNASLRMVEDLTTLPVKTRVAMRLVDLAVGYTSSLFGAPANMSAKLKISQYEFAMLVGCTRQTINLVLMEMQDLGWIKLSRSNIEICRPALLLRCSQVWGDQEDGEAIM